MNFFREQERARSKTRWLVLFYLITVGLIILAVYPAVLYALTFIDQERAFRFHSLAFPQNFWDPAVGLGTSLAVLAIVLIGSVAKIIELSRGGRAVAEFLGGRLLPPGTTDPEERQVLNIVEEVAIASGTGVPPVYLLDEEKSINAFAAGFSTRDAVIGVTHGAVKLLSRDELQGVIAHEFSHILNGDMRLNLRLMGILHGILMMTVIGRGLLDVCRPRGSRKRGGGGGGILGAVAITGFTFWLVGWIGVFFSRLIKSAISRQRESLADASAVQYTRLPVGLAGALKKIGGLSHRSVLEHPRAEEASHLYFAKGLALARLFDTHPPLEQRIKQLDPAFDGAWPLVRYPEKPRPVIEKPKPPLAVPSAAALQVNALLAGLGQLNESHLAWSASLIAEIPEFIRENLRDAVGARAVFYSLLLEPAREETKKIQRRHLFQHGNYLVYQRLLKIAQAASALPVRLRLPLVDLALPSLSTLSPAQYAMFRNDTEVLIAADGKVYPFELALKIVALHHLDGVFGREMKREAAAGEKEILEAGMVLFAFLANTGHCGNPAKAEAAFREAAAHWGEGAPAVAFKASDTADPGSVEQALSVLQGLKPAQKKVFLRACARSIRSDSVCLPEEIEVVRAFADVLDTPVGPVLG
ncbi:MAG: M48 family metallopeptidase [Candidatus Omnitrophica bacterium]|nr:M48 family metallopeptidase [Candidatus Omnitrophota bacterium]